jgi:hypothetical protein
MHCPASPTIVCQSATIYDSGCGCSAAEQRDHAERDDRLVPPMHCCHRSAKTGEATLQPQEAQWRARVCACVRACVIQRVCVYTRVIQSACVCVRAPVNVSVRTHCAMQRARDETGPTCSPRTTKCFHRRRLSASTYRCSTHAQAHSQTHTPTDTHTARTHTHMHPRTGTGTGTHTHTPHACRADGPARWPRRPRR